MELFFNLVVRADETRPMLISRMFEGTDKRIAARFYSGNTIDLIELARYPTILTKEFQDGDESTMAVIGYIDEPSMNPQISHPIMRFPACYLQQCGLLSEWGGSRTRWQVFEGDPYRLLAGLNVESGSLSSKRFPVNNSQVAVMMPFTQGPDIDPVFQAMVQGAADGGYICRRVDQLFTPADITEDVKRLIMGSRAVIADLSGMKPNVIYELGFSHGCEKRVILISSDSLDNLPFDFRQQRVIPYHASKSGLEELRSKLAEALKAI